MAKESKNEKTEQSTAPVSDPNVLVAQFQVMQQQLQNILMQKESLKMAVIEINRATEELGKSKDESAYKITGTVMVKKPIKDLKNDLAESKETLEIRLNGLKKTEKNITGKLKNLQEKLKEIIK